MLEAEVRAAAAGSGPQAAAATAARGAGSALPLPPPGDKQQFVSTDLLGGDFAHSVNTRRASLGLSAATDLGLPEFLCAPGSDADLDLAAGIRVPLRGAEGNRGRHLSLVSYTRQSSGGSSRSTRSSVYGGAHDSSYAYDYGDGQVQIQHVGAGGAATGGGGGRRGGTGAGGLGRGHSGAPAARGWDGMPGDASQREHAMERERQLRLQGEREQDRKRQEIHQRLVQGGAAPTAPGCDFDGDDILTLAYPLPGEDVVSYPSTGPSNPSSSGRGRGGGGGGGGYRRGGGGTARGRGRGENRRGKAARSPSSSSPSSSSRSSRGTSETARNLKRRRQMTDTIKERMLELQLLMLHEERAKLKDLRARRLFGLERLEVVEKQDLWMAAVRDWAM